VTDESPRVSAQKLRALARRFQFELGDQPDRLSVALLNEVLLTLMVGQAKMLESLAALGADKLEVDDAAKPVEDTEEEEHDDLEVVAEEELKSSDQEDDTAAKAPSAAAPIQVEAVDPGLARRALIAFDKRGELKRGIRFMNSWLDGVTGTPFQFRKDAGLAFLNAAEIESDGVAEREDMMRRYVGDRPLRRLGRLAHPEIDGRVLLYSY
jgi:hypothetical protein